MRQMVPGAWRQSKGGLMAKGVPREACQPARAFSREPQAAARSFNLPTCQPAASGWQVEAIGSRKFASRRPIAVRKWSSQQGAKSFTWIGFDGPQQEGFRLVADGGAAWAGGERDQQDLQTLDVQTRAR